MTINRPIRLIAALVSALPMMSSHAALLARDLDGNPATTEAYYDSTTNLTWLANWNAIDETAYDSNLGSAGGRANYADAQSWISTLTFTVGTSTFNQWRLPSLGELTALGTNELTPNGFTGIQHAYYWSSTPYPSFPNVRLVYFGDDGTVTGTSKTTVQAVTAVMSGDVTSAVPEPETYALMCLGLAVIGWQAKRKPTAPPDRT